MPPYRSDRINEEVKKELAEIFRELKDPRIPELITIVAVNVTNDLKYAKVYISTIEGGEKTKNAVTGLNYASKHIRHEIGQRIDLRRLPDFTFVADESISHGIHISSILNKIDREKK